MAKKKPAPKTPTVVNTADMPFHQRSEAEARIQITNGLSSLIGGFAPNGGFGQTISQVDTMFKNTRWYLVSNMRQLLSEMYVEFGLIKTVVDLPIDDGLRGGVKPASKQLSEDQIDQLITRLMQTNVLDEVVGQAAKWNRLFGGAGILIITGQKPDTPLDVDAIKPGTPFDLRAVDMWELYNDQLNTQNASIPSLNEAPLETESEFYSYYGKRVHKSRVMLMKGIQAPSFIRPRLRGWGVSVVEDIIRSINQYLKATDLTFEVLDEFKLDIFKIKGFNSAMMSDQGEALMRRRLELANQQKSYLNSMAMDADDSFETKELQFTGIAETLAGIRMQLASELRMPQSKLFGIPSTGFSSGEDDIENYNSMIESQVRNKIRKDVLRVLKLICAHEFGYIPDDLTFDFEALRTLSSEQEETVKTSKFNRLLAALDKGAISGAQFQDACNRGNLFDVKLDASDALNIDEAIDSAKKTDDDKEVPNKTENPNKVSKTKAPEAKEADE